MKTKTAIRQLIEFIELEILQNPQYNQSPRLREGASIVKVKAESLEPVNEQQISNKKKTNMETHSIDELLKQITDLKAEIERMKGLIFSTKNCETCKHLESENPYPCGKCDEDYSMWEFNQTK